MAIRELRPSSKTVAILAVASAMIFLAFVGTYLFSAARLKEAQSELQAKQQAVDDSKRIAQRLTEAEAAYHTALEQLSTLEKTVSKRAYIPTLLRQLEDFGRETNLRVMSIRPEDVSEPKQGSESSGDKEDNRQIKAEPAKPYKTQPINVEVSGNYWNITSFLYQITEFPKIIAVESFNVEPLSFGAASSSPQLKARLGLVAFVFDEDESQPAEIAFDEGTATTSAAKEGQEEKA